MFMGFYFGEGMGMGVRGMRLIDGMDRIYDISSIYYQVINSQIPNLILF